MIKLESTKNPPLSEYILENEIEFDVYGLFDKCGFCDGDMLTDLYYEYMEKVKGIDFKNNNSLLCSEVKPSPLFQVIEKCVMPKVKPAVTLTEYVTIHNGVRCDDDEVEFDHHFVYVPLIDVLKVFDEIYEKYLAKHHATEKINKLAT